MDSRSLHNCYIASFSITSHCNRCYVGSGVWFHRRQALREFLISYCHDQPPVRCERQVPTAEGSFIFCRWISNRGNTQLMVDCGIPCFLHRFMIGRLTISELRTDSMLSEPFTPWRTFAFSLTICHNLPFILTSDSSRAPRTPSRAGDRKHLCFILRS